MFSRLKALVSFKAFQAALASFLSEVPGAIKDHLNVAEIERIAWTALTTGGASALLPALLSNVALVVQPQDAALATGLVTVIVEVARRLGHGTTLAGSPTLTAPRPAAG